MKMVSGCQLAGVPDHGYRLPCRDLVPHFLQELLVMLVYRDYVVGMLYLDGDGTVSKQQCEIMALPAGLVLQNRSRASMTMVDGRPTAEPVSLRPGSVLEMGRSVWRILVIRAR